MNNNNKKDVVYTSIKKAIVAAIVAPIAIFIVMYFVDRSNSLTSVGLWFSFTSLLYYFTKSKQLTAYFYFKIVKVEMMILLGLASVMFIMIAS